MTNNSKSDGPTLEFLHREDDSRLAYHVTPGKSPGIVFLGGFMSDMTGTKAMALEDFCQKQGRQYTRFDYQGHGQSSGEFADGTIGCWRDDALAILDQVTVGPQVLVGSSMGGWIALLAALARPERVAGLVLVAAAPDFTDKLMWPAFSKTEQETIQKDGVLYQPSDYSDEPYAISWKLIEEGRSHNLLDGPIDLDCPMRLLHGMKDMDVPWHWSLKIAEHLSGDDVVVTLVKGGDHRLSEPEDIERLCKTAGKLCHKL